MGGLIIHDCLRKCRQENGKRPPILKGGRISGLIFLICLTRLLACTWHAFRLCSFFSHLPLSPVPLHAASADLCTMLWALALPLRAGCPSSNSSSPTFLFLTSSQLHLSALLAPNHQCPLNYVNTRSTFWMSSSCTSTSISRSHSTPGIPHFLTHTSIT